MALITCPECKKRISETAASCLRCGYVFKEGQTVLIREKEKANTKKVGIGILIALAVIVVFTLLSQSGGEKGGGERRSDSSYIKGYAKGQAIAAVSLANYDQIISLFGNLDNYKNGILDKATNESGYTGREANEYRKGTIAGFEAEAAYIKKHGKPSIK